jgi:glycosyltransferase involved in cell wall biosynthesis
VTVTVVTSAYNAERFLPRCLQSVAGQVATLPTAQPLELSHLVCDGASTDGTVRILKAHPDVQWISEPDSGQSEGFNKGVAMAKGEWICWLNGDDELAPEAISHFWHTLQSHSNADVVYGHVQFIDEQSRPVKRCYHLPYRYSLIRNNVYVPPTSGTFFRRQLFIDQPLDPSYHYVMDVEWFLRCGATLNAALSDHIFSRFRISTQGKTSDMIVSGQITQHHHEERERYRQKYIYSQWPNLSLDQAQRKLARRQRLCKIYYYWLKARYMPRYLADRLFTQTTARIA